MKINKYCLEFVVFISGATVMVFEILGSRVLGPYLGTSIFVWTSIIGIILGSLSLGYYLGGKLSDKNPHIKNLSFIFLIASGLMLFTIIIKTQFLLFLVNNITSIRFNAVVSSVILFAPVSVLLGMVSPYAVRLKIDDVQHSGSTVGNLYALSTIGSIFGTFLAGFWLIPFFGTTNILIGLSITLLLLSILTGYQLFARVKIGLGIMLIVFLIGHVFYAKLLTQNGFITIDTAYNNILIVDSVNEQGDKIRSLHINNESSSAMYLEREDLAYKYTRFYDLAEHFTSKIDNALMIGGAAYSYPQYFLKKYLHAKIDVIEIDPELTKIAKQYFNLKDSPRLQSYHEDGRTFLNRTNKKYDVIYGDAFSSIYAIPFQLTTREAVEKIYYALDDNGVAVINIISSLDGKTGKFLQAEFATYHEIFPHVELFAVDDQDVNNVQNIMLVAYKSAEKKSLVSENYEVNQLLEHHWSDINIESAQILTDEYAPVDYYIHELL